MWVCLCVCVKTTSDAVICTLAFALTTSVSMPWPDLKIFWASCWGLQWGRAEDMSDYREGQIEELCGWLLEFSTQSCNASQKWVISLEPYWNQHPDTLSYYAGFTVPSSDSLKMRRELTSGVPWVEHNPFNWLRFYWCINWQKLGRPQFSILSEAKESINEHIWNNQVVFYQSRKW